MDQEFEKRLKSIDLDDDDTLQEESKKDDTKKQ